jgi:hypothetical protein
MRNEFECELFDQGSGLLLAGKVGREQAGAVRGSGHSAILARIGVASTVRRRSFRRSAVQGS